jgi:glycosyltransferase involved in cell wall biosynthesis
LRLSDREGIEVIGTVADVRRWYEKATACIVPLRIGGGSRLKILESFAMGCPVVSTSVGAEGLNVVDGETLLLADTPEDFVQQCVRVMGDEELSRKLAENGRRLVEAAYRWDALAERLNRYLERVVE